MIAICDEPVIAVRLLLRRPARLAAPRDREAAPGEVAPSGAATPDQLEAMRETMEILSDPSGEPSSTAVRELLRALAPRPTEHGRALGTGLVGVWSAREESPRVLYAMHEDQRLVTVLCVDDR